MGPTTRQASGGPATGRASVAGPSIPSSRSEPAAFAGSPGTDRGSHRTGVEAALRSAGKLGVRSFAVATSPARCLPDFLVVGTKRGGTTSLHQYMSQHPQVLPLFPSSRHLPMRADIKGVHYFDTGFDTGLAWYRSHFPSRLHRRAVSRRLAGPVLCGEVSPYYLFHPHAPGRARSVVPHARLIVLLRNPVDRAHSHYKEQRRRGFEPLPTFEQAVDAEPGRLAGEIERLMADPHYRSFAHEHQSYVEQGKYASSLDRWLSYYPREQVHVVLSEELYADTQRIYAGVLDFLGLGPADLERPEAFNATADSSLPAGFRAELVERFAPHNVELEAMLGRPTGWPHQ